MGKKGQACYNGSDTVYPIDGCSSYFAFNLLLGKQFLGEEEELVYTS
jgi:hypothetical protein